MEVQMTLTGSLGRAVTSGSLIHSSNMGISEVCHTGIDSSTIERPIIRSAQAQDVPQIANLLLDGFQLVPPELRWFSGVVGAGLQTDIRARMARSVLCQVFVAVDPTGTVRGTVEVQIQQPSLWRGVAGGSGYLSNLTVAAGYRRSGLATALIKACEEQVITWGKDHLYLHVMGNNASARRLYLRSGYRIQSRTEEINLFSGNLKERLLLHRPLVVPPVVSTLSSIL
jgi:ribosomal protein S18 acetylase RimI-like enzyme